MPQGQPGEEGHSDSQLLSRSLLPWDLYGSHPVKLALTGTNNGKHPELQFLQTSSASLAGQQLLTSAS